MSLEFLERLYWAVSSGPESYPLEGHRLGELRKEIAATSAAYNALMEQLEQVGTPYSSIDSKLADVTNAYEQQGFINGFRLGLMLSRELEVAAPCQRS